MNKKIISVFTLFAFIVFSISCYTTRTKDVKTVADLQRKNVKILSVVKITGEYLISQKKPGQLYQNSIIGGVRELRNEIEINRNDIKDISRDKKGKILGITKKDSKIYHVFTEVTYERGKHQVFIGKANETEDKIILSGKIYELISIPLSEVKEVKYVERKKLSPWAAIGIVLSIVVVVFAVATIIVIIQHSE